MENAFTIDLVDEDIACRIIGGERTPIHKSTLRRGINAGRYPAPIKVGPGTNRWRAQELIETVERAAAERDLAR
jgi:predicted DNA-binding transcriptional regulator AlpA